MHLRKIRLGLSEAQYCQRRFWHKQRVVFGCSLEFQSVLTGNCSRRTVNTTTAGQLAKIVPVQCCKKTELIEFHSIRVSSLAHQSPQRKGSKAICEAFFSCPSFLDNCCEKNRSLLLYYNILQANQNWNYVHQIHPIFFLEPQRLWFFSVTCAMASLCAMFTQAGRCNSELVQKPTPCDLVI